MKKITIEEVRHLANLSSLEFTDEELESFIGDFENILNFVEQVSTCEIDEDKLVYPCHKLSLLREDEAKQSLPQEEILLNSPKTKKGCFCVPKMLD